MAENESGLTNEQIEAAVRWWLEALGHPRFDNGDPSQTGGMTMIFASMAHTPPNASALEKFGSELAERLRHDEWGARHGLHVDYHPEELLAEVAHVSGLSTGVVSFPWKTNMWFSNGGVKVSAGYGAPHKWVMEPVAEHAVGEE